MSWNVGQKLNRDQKLVELLGDRIGRWGQAIFGDHYVLEKDLYGGAWSETWLASRQGQTYVIKTLKHNIFNDSGNKEILASYLRYFNDEAKALAKCEHQHIVKIIERLFLPLERNRPCIVMEYIQGMTLTKWVRQQGKLSSLEAVKYVQQIGNALAAMHSQSYLHHDVKPDNIMIRDLTTTANRCEAVLIDLGVARQFIPEMIRSYTFTPGTSGFCPPEVELAQIEMQKQLILNPSAEFKLHIEQSASIDVYSLAATLYFMITGRQPRDLPFAIPDEVEPAIQEAIKVGMAKNPEQRPQSIGEWLVMLPLTFKDLYRFNGNVVEYDLNDPNQGTYNLHKRGVNTFQPELLEIDLGKGVKLELVNIPAGSFMMGGSNDYDSEKPIHLVTLKAFKMSKYPITQKQYKVVMGKNPSHFKGDENCPVEQVNWHDAVAFCEKLSKMTGQKVKLPSEAQWEYACRAGSTGKYCFGDDDSQLRNYAWYRENNDSKTHPVGQKRPNNLGLYDMHGNVWEWCEDAYHKNYNNAPGDGCAWNTGGDKSTGVLRGGSWYDNGINCRSANRSRYDADNYYSYVIGFRVVV